MAQWNIPADLKYTKSDEWIRLEGDEAVVGVSDYAQSSLSTLTFVDLPKVGATFKAGEQFGAVESTKAASDIYIPVGGTISAVNSALENDPEVINNDPYGAGWMVRLKPTNKADIDGLLDAAAYTKHCEERG